MMRENMGLYRGKRKDNGEWVIGFLVDKQDIGNWVSSEPVHPETVGQFTGLTDKNGAKIFEDDICDMSILGVDHSLMKIVIRNCSVGYEPVFPDKVHPDDQRWKSFWRDEDQEMLNTDYFTVIGNIHDNKEAGYK